MTNQQRGNRKEPKAQVDRTGSGNEGKARDAGAYIGRLPERATETIPGGVGPKDVRVAAVATQPGPVRGGVPGKDSPAEGHREGEAASDDRVREAGQNR